MLDRAKNGVNWFHLPIYVSIFTFFFESKKDLNSLEKVAMSDGINWNDVYPENFNFTEIDSLKEHFKRKDRTTPIDIGRPIL